jgi:hypothetical protein
MALVLKDRVKETSTTAGTGTLTLDGAVVGYQTFNSVVATSSTVYYTIQNTAIGYETEWEVGVGTFTATASLSRDTVLSSSNSGSLVNFSTSPELQVFITQPAEEAIYLNQATGKVEIGGNGTNTVSFTNINTTNLTANTVTVTAGTITTNAANATDITNKTYVDGLFSTGISYHDPVNYEVPATQGNLVAVYNQPNGAGNGVSATLTNNAANVAFVADGVTVSAADRILVYNQTNGFENGVYGVTNVGAPDSPGPGSKWVLTRTTDADTFGLASPNKLGQGDAFFVLGGNTGAGETYICNTPGTITFGTTDITFALISSSQVYSAGTGLNLANLTFSISNTAITAGTYGNDGNVATFTVNAQGQLTNAANTAINASSITLGTLANARTTANSANGASTIVARDSNGSFTTNVVTATDVNATNVTATTGSFTNVSGNGATLTNINASNISSGTIDNARTTGNTANSASTLVLRDTNGSFGANIISASFNGDGSAISAINASNLSSGTVANARTTAASANGASTIVARDSGGNFSANTITANISGNGSGITAINASNISSGTIGNAYTTANSSNGAATIVLRGASGEFAAGQITASSFSGNGSALTAINASNISSGTIDNARTNATSANGASTLVVRDANGSFAGNVITGTTGTFTSVSGNGIALTGINASNITSGTLSNTYTTANSANGASTIVARDSNGSFSANIVTATFSGNAASITNINASNITSGTINNAFTTANSANGASTIVARDANGSFAGNVVTGTTGTFTNISGNGVALTAINASNVTSGTLDNARTTASSSNGANTIVLRDASGDFSVDGITANWLTGNGANISAINGSNVTTGTVANARTTANSSNGASTIVLRDANGSFAGNVISASSFSGNGSAISAINASSISSGTIGAAYVSGSYTNVTGLGAITVGTWNANVISATYGGTGSANLTANNVVLGNGANTVKVVAPGTANNVLTSDGTTWISQAPTSSAGGAGTITRTDFTASASQTVFTVSYTVGLIDVYRNGVKLATTDFTATNGTSFTLATGANAGDIIQAEVFSSLNIYSTITADTFSGNAVQTTFTMSVSPYSTASVLVAVSGVVQEPSTYTVSTNTLTFSAAPPTGTNNISVRYLGVAAASSGNASYDTATTSTGYFAISAGTTAQRPGTPTNGMLRYNTTNGEYEVYLSSATAWKAITTQAAGVYTVDYLVVAGGGGGGNTRAGGGGAGGLLSANALSVTSGTAYTVTIGAGGAASTAGSNSVFSTFTSVGGGRGGSYVGAGTAGGSGGGGSAGASGGAGTAGQGSAGGTGFQGVIDGGGGGGGASAVGANANSSQAGNGGAGTNWLSLGTSYAGGGAGGATDTYTTATGGAGGGGNGYSFSGAETAGTVNRGGGGGGGGSGAAGGSGIVIVRYLGGTRGSGGTITSAGGYTYHTFTASGTFTA